MPFQFPNDDVVENILINQKPVSPLDLTEVTDSEGQVLSQDEAELKLNDILGEAGPLPAMVFPLMKELISEDSPLTNAHINTVTHNGIVAGQMIEVRLYGAGSLDRYQAVADLKEQLEPWMSVLSHAIFGLGKASLSDRLDKEFKGRAGRPKGGVYLQLSWAFDFVPHSELYEYVKKETPAQSQGATQEPQPQTQGQGGQPPKRQF